MATITKRILHLRPTFHSHARPYPYTQHHFSSSSNRDDVPQSEQSQTQSSVSSSFNAVRASLRNLPPPPERRQPPRSPFSFSSGAPNQTPPPSRGGSRDEISSRLAEFRSRSAPPPPGSPHSAGQYVSMQELYEKNIKSNGESPTAPPGLGTGGRQSVNYIRESFSKYQSTGAVNPGRSLSESLSFSRYAENLKNKADPNANIDGGKGNFFLKEKMGKGGGGMGSRKMLFGKAHDRSSLGEKLKTMRPEKRKGKWFSLQELSDRLAKVRVADEKELEKAGFPFHAIQQSIQNITQDVDQQKKEKARSCKQFLFSSSFGFA